MEKEYYIDDGYLIAYPGAGQEWLKRVFTKALELSGIETDNAFIQCEEWWPWEATEKKRVLYLLRDPRDMVVSAYHQKPDRDETLSEFVRSAQGMANTVAHIRAWANCSGKISYEALVSDTAETLAMMFDFYGFEASKDVIRLAVSTSDFRSMSDRHDLSEEDYAYCTEEMKDIAWLFPREQE